MADQINKFIHLRRGLGSNLEAIKDAVFKITGYQLKPNQFKWNGQKVYFSDCPPPLHTEILIKKAVIMRELKTTLGTGAPKDLI